MKPLNIGKLTMSQWGTLTWQHGITSDGWGAATLFSLLKAHNHVQNERDLPSLTFLEVLAAHVQDPHKEVLESNQV